MALKMAVNKTLYVRSEDAPIWDKAKEVIGDSLSTYLTNHLRKVVASRQAAAQGAERIILSFTDAGILKTKAFYGRWLITPAKPFEVWRTDITGEIDSQWPPDNYAVAITTKNNVVVFKFDEMKGNGKFGRGTLRVFDSFEEAHTGSRIPDGLIATAMEVLGVEVEELDI